MGTSSGAHGRRCWFNRLVLGKIHITTYPEGQVRQLWDQAFARGAGAETRPWIGESGWRYPAGYGIFLDGDDIIVPCCTLMSSSAPDAKPLR